jgi:hypothetical protein
VSEPVAARGPAVGKTAVTIRSLLSTGATVLLLTACGGADGGAASSADETVTVTLKVSSFTSQVTVGWNVMGASPKAADPRQESPPWSTEFAVRRGSRVSLTASIGVSACEILVDGESVAKDRSTMTGESAECAYEIG